MRRLRGRRRIRPSFGIADVTAGRGSSVGAA